MAHLALIVTHMQSVGYLHCIRLAGQVSVANMSGHSSMCNAVGDVCTVTVCVHFHQPYMIVGHSVRHTASWRLCLQP